MEPNKGKARVSKQESEEFERASFIARNSMEWTSGFSPCARRLLMTLKCSDEEIKEDLASIQKATKEGRDAVIDHARGRKSTDTESDSDTDSDSFLSNRFTYVVPGRKERILKEAGLLDTDSETEQVSPGSVRDFSEQSSARDRQGRTETASVNENR